MPELPDVEGFRRKFNRHAKGQKVNRVRAAEASATRNTSPQALGRALRHRRFLGADRHGKWLLARTDGPTVVFHFGMTGSLAWSGEPGPVELERHDRLAFELGVGSLVYRSQRKLGGVWLARSGDEERAITGDLGPDADKIDMSTFVELMSSRKAGVKAALMDQKMLAGIGNELSDEVLWRARLHPSTSCTRFSDRELGRLHETMTSTIREANRHGRIPPKRGWLESVRDEHAPKCPRCQAPIRRGKAAGRTAYWCPRCQPA